MRDAAALAADLADRARPLETDAARAWWDAAVEATPANEQRREAADVARSDFLADTAAFEAVRAARAAGAADPLLARQLDLLHHERVPHQVPGDLRHRIVELQVSVEATFSRARGTVAGERVDDNEILRILRTSDDTGLREEAWRASKEVGAEVAGDVRELARLRNEAARHLGARDWFALALATSELDEDRLFATLDEVDRVTAAPFAAWKGALDERLAQRYACAADDLRPWHLDDPFFQDVPIAAAVDLDPVFEGRDLEALTLRTFDGLGLDVQPVLERSDLYPRDGKNQHAFCIDIDREGDVRVLCNVTDTERWAETMLHEFGHGVYFAAVDRSLPWLLRTMHALTTEGVAMLCGRLVRRPEWLAGIAGVEPGRVEALLTPLAAARRASLLVFARWVLVMTNFERGLYADPGGDHDTRWWDLVERYQRVRRPDGRHAPDWAAKIHLAAAPVYYQNYLYGELFASQVGAALTERCGGLVDRTAAGEFLTERVFRPGAAVRWDRLVEDATGAPLGAAALGRDLSAG